MLKAIDGRLVTVDYCYALGTRPAGHLVMVYVDDRPMWYNDLTMAALVTASGELLPTNLLGLDPTPADLPIIRKAAELYESEGRDVPGFDPHPVALSIV